MLCPPCFRRFLNYFNVEPQMLNKPHKCCVCGTQVYEEYYFKKLQMLAPAYYNFKLVDVLGSLVERIDELENNT